MSKPRPSSAQVTRDLILKRAGYGVVSADDPADVTRVFASSPAHPVALCDSLQAAERLELARLLKHLKGWVTIVALSRTSGTQMPASLVDEQLECPGDPQLLLDALRRVLPLEDDEK